MYHDTNIKKEGVFDSPDYFLNNVDKLSSLEAKLLNERVEVSKKYNLPKNLQFCTECVISNQRPRIVFDETGVCGACKFWKKKFSQVDWAFREREFEELCNSFRKSDGSYDVVVPFSGGKDSIYVARELKVKYNMNPLTVTWAPHVYTEVGFRNLLASVHSGLNNVLITPNGHVHRLMTRISTNLMGDPFQPFIYGQTLAPLKIADFYNIPFVVYGENGEVEYGGAREAEKARGFDEEEAKKFLHSGIAIDTFKEFGFSEADLFPYRGPSLENIQKKGIKRYFYSYFHKWLPQLQKLDK